MGLFEFRARKKDVSQSMMGMGVSGAGTIAQPTSAYIPKGPDSREFAILPALFGGGLAAAVGGGIWGLIVILTNHVIGYMALGIGLMCGYAVVLFSRGGKGMPLQVIAVLSSVLGIAIGKYATFFYLVKKAVAKQYGEAAAANVSFLSEKVLQVFVHNFGSRLSAFDILWVLLAVITAWRIPKAIGAKPQA